MGRGVGRGMGEFTVLGKGPLSLFLSLGVSWCKEDCCLVLSLGHPGICCTSECIPSPLSAWPDILADLFTAWQVSLCVCVWSPILAPGRSFTFGLWLLAQRAHCTGAKEVSTSSPDALLLAVPLGPASSALGCVANPSGARSRSRAGPLPPTHTHRCSLCSPHLIQPPVPLRGKTGAHTPACQPLDSSAGHLFLTVHWTRRVGFLFPYSTFYLFSQPHPH